MTQKQHWNGYKCDLVLEDDTWIRKRTSRNEKHGMGTEEDSIEATWSYPIDNHLRIYARAFKDYGESLLDYDREVDRIGIGFAINDILMR